MASLLIFGPGYSAGRIAERLSADGWKIARVRRHPAKDAIGVEDHASVRNAISSATHILSSVPPDDDGDMILRAYADALRGAPARWIGYLSSTGVYGDAGGAWVDETTPADGDRRSARAAADRGWRTLRSDVRVFRLPGIYGPGRSALDRIVQGKAHRIDIPGQVFSRIHVDDIASGVIAGLNGPPGAYNLADDMPAPQHEVIAYACRLLGLEPPPLQTLDEAALSPMARGFYAENRRVANGKAKRLLGWWPAWPDYRAGLRALSATMSPTIASTPPAMASADHR